MIPTHQHLTFGNGERLCGDKTKTSYIGDFDFRKLPLCEKCFPEGKKKILDVEVNRSVEKISAAQPEQEKIISEDYKRFLRDYQKGK